MLWLSLIGPVLEPLIEQEPQPLIEQGRFPPSVALTTLGVAPISWIRRSGLGPARASLVDPFP